MDGGDAAGAVVVALAVVLALAFGCESNKRVNSWNMVARVFFLGDPTARRARLARGLFVLEFSTSANL